MDIKVAYYFGGDVLLLYIYCDNEQWSDIKSEKIRNNYEVSTHGRIRNKLTGTILKPYTNKNGYRIVSINDKRVHYKKNTNISIHRQVAINFINNSDNYKKIYVNHKDGDKQNNHYSNLEWTTPSENKHHAYDNFLEPRGPSRFNSVFEESQIHEICKMIELGYKNKEISKVLINKYNIPKYRAKNIICDIKAKKSWQYISNNYNINKSHIKSSTTIENDNDYYNIIIK